MEFAKISVCIRLRKMIFNRIDSELNWKVLLFNAWRKDLFIPLIVIHYFMPLLVVIFLEKNKKLSDNWLVN